MHEVLLTLDLHRSPGRFSAAYDERLPGMQLLLAECCDRYPHAKVRDVNYAPDMVAEVGSKFFGRSWVPAKTWYGSAFYSYLFGLNAAKHNYVFHLDSDLLFGGGSRTWAGEAVRLLTQRKDALACSPLPGPPTTDGQLRSQSADPEPHTSLAFRFPQVSTRLFLIDRDRLLNRIGPLPLEQPPRIRIWQARLQRQPPYSDVEVILSHAMSSQGLRRIDFLGNPPGMWSLHPPYRSTYFYDHLAELIQRIESGDIPEAQRGHHDVNDSMVDWTQARDARPWWRSAGRVVMRIADRLV